MVPLLAWKAVKVSHIQYAKRYAYCQIVICGLSSCAAFSSQNWHDAWGGGEVTEHEMCVLIFSATSV